MFKHVLVAVDGSDNATRALEVAASLAELANADLTLVHVVRSHAGGRLPSHLKAFDAIEHASNTQEDILQDAARELLHEAEVVIGDRPIEVQSAVIFGNPARLIVDHASQIGADLIVMGSRGLSDLKGLLIGSVSHQVSQLADCGVLLVK